MVAGLAFLSKKSFNPKNLSNQKQVWEARQQKANDEKKARERAQQLRREKDEEELAFARDGTRGAAQSSLKFMYDVPPGLKQQLQNQQSNERKETADAGNGNAATSTTNGHQLDLAKRQPGDDDAAAAFRKMLAAASAPNSEGTVSEGMNSSDPSTSFAFSNSSGAALQGTTVEDDKSKKIHMSALEKAVGKRTAGGMTLEEQIARFPQLKDAPMAKGMTSTNVHVSFKPLGTQLRNVRCLACGVWGHSRGDRECQVSGWDPFGASAAATGNRTGGLKRQPDEQQETGERDERGQRSERRDDRRRKKKSKRKRRYSSDSSNSDSDSDSSSSSEEERRRRRRRRKERKRRRKEERRSRRRDRSPEPEKRRHKSSRRYDSDSN